MLSADNVLTSECQQLPTAMRLCRLEESYSATDSRATFLGNTDDAARRLQQQA